MRQLIVAFCFALSSLVHAETIVNPLILGGQLQGSQAIGAFKIPTGNTLPVTCIVGQTFFKANASAGSNLYGCTATDTWTAQAGGGGGGASPGGSTGDWQTNGGSGSFGAFTPGSGVQTWAVTPSGANLATALTTALPQSKGGAGTITGALKGNGSGVVSQAACADLSDSTSTCSTAIGTSGATIPLLNGANTWSDVQSFNDGDFSLKGSSSGTLGLHAAATASTSSITFPAGTTDFSATGAAHQVVRQSTSGGAFTVGQLAASDLTDGVQGTGNLMAASGGTASSMTITALTVSSVNGGTLVTGGTLTNTDVCVYSSSGGGTLNCNTVSTNANTNSAIVQRDSSGNFSAGTITAALTGVASGNTLTIGSGTAALGTSAISSGACATTVTGAVTGAAATDNLSADFNADPTAVTGYGASATGAVLTIYKWITSGQVNFKVCNNTSGSITPSAATLQYRVMR